MVYALPPHPLCCSQRHLPHSRPTVDVHITVNTLPLPNRRGIGCIPFVFMAQSHDFEIERPFFVPDDPLLIDEDIGGGSPTDLLLLSLPPWIHVW